jgi:hypothetical protein
VSKSCHLLLIGCDNYPPGKQLAGCVNDIDAIERIYVEPPGVGVPLEGMRVTRLAAPLAGARSTSHFQQETAAPTRANIVDALRHLAGPEVGPEDRVFICYSGHGTETLFAGSSTYHEALVPIDLAPIYDIELNSLVHAIAARTPDVTLTLDCCHSAGVSRDARAPDDPMGDRFLPLPAPAPGFGPADVAVETTSQHGAVQRMLRSMAPVYVGVVACQGAQKASEGRLEGERPMGVFTYSLVGLLREIADPMQREELRWGYIWPDLLVRVQDRTAALRRGQQNPELIGRPERRVFGGGPWNEGDLGFQIRRTPNGFYEIRAGRLLGVTEGAELAVYGPTPLTFPALGRHDDNRARLGRLRVAEANRATAVAGVLGAAFDLPRGARARLIAVGRAERLRVVIEPTDDAAATALKDSALIELVSNDAPDPEIRVSTRPNGGWIISNDVEVGLASVPAGGVAALRAALESYYSHYARALRLAAASSDPALAGSISVRLLDWNGDIQLDPSSPAIQDRPEAPRDPAHGYALPPTYRFCIEIASTYAQPLKAVALNCGAAGQVEFLDDTMVRTNDRQLLWQRGQVGRPFVARPDFSRVATDRVVVVGTTRPDVDVKGLQGPRLQNVVDDTLRTIRSGAKSMLEEVPVADAGTAELWTATIVPVKMLPS